MLDLSHKVIDTHNTYWNGQVFIPMPSIKAVAGDRSIPQRIWSYVAGLRRASRNQDSFKRAELCCHTACQDNRSLYSLDMAIKVVANARTLPQAVKDEVVSKLKAFRDKAHKIFHDEWMQRGAQYRKEPLSEARCSAVRRKDPVPVSFMAEISKDAFIAALKDAGVLNEINPTIPANADINLSDNYIVFTWKR